MQKYKFYTYHLSNPDYALQSDVIYSGTSPNCMILLYITTVQLYLDPYNYVSQVQWMMPFHLIPLILLVIVLVQLLQSHFYSVKYSKQNKQ